jgi:hypothetical protein
MPRPHSSHHHRARAAACALLLALLPCRAAPAASLPELTPVPRSSRFT